MSRRPRGRRRGLGIAAILIGVVVGCFVLELFSIAWVTLEEGKYVSAQALFARTPNTFFRPGGDKSGCTPIDEVLPHPYLAYVHHGDPPCGFKGTNNIGLYGPDFPKQKITDRYVVLLTGASIAVQVGGTQTTPPRFLEEALNRRYTSPNGQPFLVLTGAEGGWKEPQQFILFSMYARLLDAVVTLDGYNEYLAFSPKQRFALEFPDSRFNDVNPLFRGDFSDLVMGWLISRSAHAITALPVLDHSHAVYLLYRALTIQARRWDVMQYERRTRIDTMFGLPKETIGDGDKIFAEQLARYQGYKISTDSVASAHHVKSAYFLAPMPAWGKMLSDEEKQHVGDMSYLGRYRELVAGMMTLRQRGLPIYDLGDVFQNEPGTIYMDHIHCAYQGDTSRGYELMAARMADNIAEAWKLQRKP